MIATPQAVRDGSSAILRVDKTQGCWEAVPKALIEDTRLSLETRAAAIWILARPDGWTICATVLPRLLAVGRSKARRFLRELARAGYLERKLRRGAN